MSQMACERLMQVPQALAITEMLDMLLLTMLTTFYKSWLFQSTVTSALMWQTPAVFHDPTQTSLGCSAQLRGRINRPCWAQV
jgi:hypothetical protein